MQLWRRYDIFATAEHSLHETPFRQNNGLNIQLSDKSGVIIRINNSMMSSEFREYHTSHSEGSFLQ